MGNRDYCEHEDWQDKQDDLPDEAMDVDVEDTGLDLDEREFENTLALEVTWGAWLLAGAAYC